MTPEEHYHEAELLLRVAESQANGPNGVPDPLIAPLAALAQAHATLATVKPLIQYVTYGAGTTK